MANNDNAVRNKLKKQLQKLLQNQSVQQNAPNQMSGGKRKTRRHNKKGKKSRKNRRRKSKKGLIHSLKKMFKL